MSEALQILLIIGAYTFAAGCYVWLWAHTRDCEQKRIAAAQTFAEVKGKLDYLLKEVGQEHGEGMRARLHFLENRERARGK